MKVDMQSHPKRAWLLLEIMEEDEKGVNNDYNCLKYL